MKFENSFSLISYIHEVYGNKVMLSFSCGKDSLATWVFLKKNGFEVYPVYLYYFVPDLGFVEKSLSYYENFFETRIQRFPHPATIQQVDEGLYQHDFYDFKFRKADYLLLYDYEETLNFAKKDLELPIETPVAVGLSQANNPTRRIILSRFGALNEKTNTFYPIFDFKEGFCLRMIFEAGLKLPFDYKIWGRSYDGINARFLKGVKENYPNDFEKLKKAYPLIELELLKYQL